MWIVAVLVAVVALLAIGGLVVTLIIRKLANRFAPKSGPLAILFTDVESSTTLWELCGHDMKHAMHIHNEVIRRLINEYQAYEVKTNGDSFMIACKSLTDATLLSLAIQTSLNDREDFPPSITEAYERLHANDVARNTPPPPPSEGIAARMSSGVFLHRSPTQPNITNNNNQFIVPNNQHSENLPLAEPDQPASRQVVVDGGGLRTPPAVVRTLLPLHPHLQPTNSQHNLSQTAPFARDPSSPINRNPLVGLHDNVSRSAELAHDGSSDKKTFNKVSTANGEIKGTESAAVGNQSTKPTELTVLAVHPGLSNTSPHRRSNHGTNEGILHQNSVPIKLSPTRSRRMTDEEDMELLPKPGSLPSVENPKNIDFRRSNNYSDGIFASQLRAQQNQSPPRQDLTPKANELSSRVSLLAPSLASSNAKVAERAATTGRQWNGLRVRIGLQYCTEVNPQVDKITQRYDYFGHHVNVAARVEGYAYGGQVLVQGDTYQALTESQEYHEIISPDCVITKVAEEAELKGVHKKVPLYSLLPLALSGRRFKPLANVILPQKDDKEKSGDGGEIENNNNTENKKANEDQKSSTLIVKQGQGPPQNGGTFLPPKKDSLLTGPGDLSVESGTFLSDNVSDQRKIRLNSSSPNVPTTAAVNMMSQNTITSAASNLLSPWRHTSPHTASFQRDDCISFRSTSHKSTFIGDKTLEPSLSEGKQAVRFAIAISNTGFATDAERKKWLLHLAGKYGLGAQSSTNLGRLTTMLNNAIVSHYVAVQEVRRNTCAVPQSHMDMLRSNNQTTHSNRDSVVFPGTDVGNTAENSTVSSHVQPGIF